MTIYRQNYTTPNVYASEALARKSRDRTAKELRSEGHPVKVGRTSFEGLGYGVTYWLEYRKDD